MAAQSKRKGFLFIVLLWSIGAVAQNGKRVDSIIRNYPKSASSAERLAARLQKDFVTEYDRARAIYTWIALNITYDVDLYRKSKSGPVYAVGKSDKEIEQNTVNGVLLTRKAVCDGYATLFTRLASLTGLESEKIEGMAKTTLDDLGNDRLESNHAWNTVKIDGKWRLVDATWGSGFMIGNAYKKRFDPFYFDTLPKLFFLKHYPESGKWNGEAVDKQKFINTPLFYYDSGNCAYEMVMPVKGIMAVELGRNMRFQIKNLTGNPTIWYSSKKEESIEVTLKKDQGGILEFEIPVDANIGNELFIYIDNDAFAAFKINIK